MGCLLSISTLKMLLSDLAKQDITAVLTHGAFDIFHSGHAYFLKESKKLGDYLIVGIESDERIQTYKSESRPIQALNDRIHVLSANISVDFIFAIDELPFKKGYYRDLYKDLSPNIVTYGEEVNSILRVNNEKGLNPNIRFELIQYSPDIMLSTTSLIDRIVRAV